MSTQSMSTRSEGLPVGLFNAVAIWADGSTDMASPRRKDLRRDKAKAVLDFFTYANKGPGLVEPEDVKLWQVELEKAGLTPATIYAKVSRVSSFFTWAQEVYPDLITINPVDAARPKAPKPYTSDRTKSLSDEDLDNLLAHVKARADVIGKRDYAILLFLSVSGWRRAEVIGLRWGDIRMNDGLICNVRVKGGKVKVKEIGSIAVKEALLDYLKASDRFDTMEPDSPLWTRHDKSGTPGKALSSHAVAKAMKKYADQVGIDNFHLHQTRHTAARLVGEEEGSLLAVQDFLDHDNLGTTKVYVEKIGLKPDKYGKRIAQRLGVE